MKRIILEETVTFSPKDNFQKSTQIFVVKELINTTRYSIGDHLSKSDVELLPLSNVEFKIIAPSKK